jgi:phenylacetate-CoA ligase
MPSNSSRASGPLGRRFFDLKMRVIDSKARGSMKGLMAAQALSADALAALNWERRLALVRVCAAKIPFYQRAFREIGFEPGDLKSEADWNRLPVLEKQDIRTHTQALVDSAYRLDDLPTATTGGTTGLPLKTYNDPRVHLASMSWRMLDWWGVHPASNSGYLYRAIPRGAGKALRDVALLPTRRAYIAASDMSETRMAAFLTELQAIEPEYLVGYVGALDVFARYCEAHGTELPSLKAIWTTASPLSDSLRAHFETVFRTPTYTQYGSCEFNWIAAECSHTGGMHIGSDIRHVDVLPDPEGFSEDRFGDLAVTDLRNHVFPLLRYRLGDRGRLLDHSCPCGLPFPMMDYVRGRISDTLELRDGTRVPGEFWTTVFDDFVDDVSAFQVAQQADGTIQIRYVPNPHGDGAGAAQTVLERLRAQTQGQADIEMKRVAEIPHRDGKVQIVTRADKTMGMTAR